MEEQHPIPQQISSYQFRLVGDMTLKQFFQVAGGAVIALLFYASALPGYIKWPGVLISFLAGIALAFFPIQDRPLSLWLLLFFKSIYSPTIFVWKKKGEQNYFQPESATPAVIDTAPLTTPTINVAPPEPIEPVIPMALETTDINTTQKDNILNSEPVAYIDPTPPPPFIEEAKQKDSLAVPKPIAPEIKIEENKQQENLSSAQANSTGYISPSVGTKVEGVKEAQFSPGAAPPTPPTRPNVIVGQVMDTTGNIIENAILEIKDESGRSVRALRSNKLGHFMIVTPLDNGNYHVITEKEGYEFEPLTIKMDGDIIPPIAITPKTAETKTDKEDQTIYSQT